ncbi:MAG TPA: alpha/beta fold hydrolase, partial [Rhodospirillales bacterium]|nr:alpha/beta fold hydrolase [Rhodospirillales bacterium]
MEPQFSPDQMPERVAATFDGTIRQGELMSKAFQRHAERIGRTHSKRLRERFERTTSVLKGIGGTPAAGQGWIDLASSYFTDSFQRAILTLDVLRERGNNDIAHEADGTPPVLIYKYEIAVDGAKLKRPVNYMLLKILPPEGIEIFAWKRPYMIIDPRAGHGAGIGGFKEDSQVGVALRDGHPVYFVAFRPHPEPGQTLADVMRAEVEFIREIARLHPKAPKPIVVGNCQGGWAALLLAAANSDITGPLVINGAPVAYWSGRVGENPMRYNGGLLGGVMPAMLFSDLGHGQFDGAHLVSNFEGLNPSRNHWGKYFDLYSDVEGGRERFLEFERWWGGFHFMNEAEIRWIVEQLFVGNKLARGEARLEHGRHLDLKKIRSPIIVFASHGDNITPPQQALNWIVDTYTDENEIKIRGQRIIYMVHDK